MTTFNVYAVRISNLNTLEVIEFIATSLDNAFDRIVEIREDFFNYEDRDALDISIQGRQVEGVK